MLVLRKYGIVCSVCHHQLPAGATELEDTVQIEALQRTLREKGWTGERLIAHGPNPNPDLQCRKITPCRAEDVIFLD
jgi:hypothetical protein